MNAAVFSVSAMLFVLGALGVVTLRHPVHAALSLVTSMFGVALLFILLGAHLLAAVQIIVYASAIVVLFLFVIMLIGVDTEEETPHVGGWSRVAGIAAGLLVGVQLIVLGWTHWVTGPKQVSGSAFTRAADGNVRTVATEMFTKYVWPFELVAGLLVVAVVGAVVIARGHGAGPILTEDEAVAAELERTSALAEVAPEPVASNEVEGVSQ